MSPRIPPGMRKSVTQKMSKWREKVILPFMFKTLILQRFKNIEAHKLVVFSLAFLGGVYASEDP